METTRRTHGFVLFQGGPFYRLEAWLRIDRIGSLGVTGRAIAAFILGWVGLASLSALVNKATFWAFLYDVRAQDLTLAVLPLLLAFDGYVDSRLSSALRQLVGSRIVHAPDRRRFSKWLRTARRIRDSVALEVVFLVVAFALSQLRPLEKGATAWAFEASGHRLNVAGIYYVAVLRPLMGFLAMRWIARFIVWSWLLFQISRLNLALVPTHPDRRGGVRFLTSAQASFWPLVAAGAFIVAAATYNRGLFREQLIVRAAPQLAYALGALVVVFAPLGCLSQQLWWARRLGVRRFSRLAALHSREFERKWFVDPLPADAVTAPDFSSLTDLAASFHETHAMNWFPYTLYAYVTVFSVSFIPVVVELAAERRLVSVIAMLLSKKI